MNDKKETVWSLERLKGATIAPRVAAYDCLPANGHEEHVKATHPGIFHFEAISIGDDKGQAFLVPLDESGRETAGMILEAIKFYKVASRNKDNAIRGLWLALSSMKEGVLTDQEAELFMLASSHPAIQDVLSRCVKEGE